MKVMLAGASGFVGIAVREALATAGAIDLIVLARPGQADLKGSTVPVDLQDFDAVASILDRFKPHCFINAAGRVTGTPAELYRDNCAVPVTIAEAILKASAHTILIHVGSAAEYGRQISSAPIRESDPCRPRGAYGLSKLAAAQHLLALSDDRALLLSHLRLFNPMGVRNTSAQVVGAFLERLAAAGSGGRVHMGNLGAVRDFIALDDVSRFIARIVLGRQAIGTVNVCSGRGRVVRDVIAYLINRSGKAVELTEMNSTEVTDVMVGDPGRFLEFAGPNALTPLHDILDRALIAAQRHEPGEVHLAINSTTAKPAWQVPTT